MSSSPAGASTAPASARAAAIVTWVYAAAFGLPAVPIAVFALRERRLPRFFDLFPMNGGPWSETGDWNMFARLSAVFLGVMLVAGIAGALLWRGRRAGAILTFALIPIEAIFWWGFAVPFPPLVGVARAVLAAVSWPRLRR